MAHDRAILQGLEQSSLFRPEIDEGIVSSVPAHVGLIMDGNRRWAAQKGLPTMMGHLKGAENLLEIVETAAKLGVRFLTLFAFSTENWRRDPAEVAALFAIFQKYLGLYEQAMVERGVRLRVIGDVQRLPPDLLARLQQTLELTAEGTSIDLILAINYGSRDEIVRATRRAVQQVQAGLLQLDEINEQWFSKTLDTGQFPDPDLIIRTSGEYRLSNFLLWQAGYAEVVPLGVLWPDFSPDHLIHAIREYQTRIRRCGR